MKKTISLALCLALAFALLAACGGTSSPAPDGADRPSESAGGGGNGGNGGEAGSEHVPYAESNQTPAGTFPIVYERETLRAAIYKQTWITDLKENTATKWLQDKLNVDFEFEYLPEDWTEAVTKINLMLSSGQELPDMIVQWGHVSNSQLAIYGQQGTFLALDGYIDPWGPALKKTVELVPFVLQAGRSSDGKLYHYPHYSEGGHDLTYNKMWFNSAWCDALGLPLPSTTDEFYDTLLAFRDNDANGNGDSGDEIPLITATDSWGGDLLGYLMNPFVISTSKDHQYYYLENDQVKVPYTQEGWKEGLAYIHRLYADGLLDKECFVIKQDQTKALVENPGGNRIGAVPTGFIGAVCDMTKPAPRDEFEVLPPLKGPSGLRQTPHFLSTVNSGVIITRDAKSPITAFRVADAFAYATQAALSGDEAGLEWNNFLWGPEGEAWDKASAGAKGLGGLKDAYHKVHYIWGEPTNWNWGNIVSLYAPIEGKERMEIAQDAYDFENMLYRESVEKMEPYAIECCVPPLAYDEAQATMLADLELELQNYASDAWVQFIAGEKDIDAEWENYLSTIDSLGLSQVLEIKQAAYDLQYRQ
jgi:putative aldouronate transport system substrate-binding protein